MALNFMIHIFPLVTQFRYRLWDSGGDIRAYFWHDYGVALRMTRRRPDGTRIPYPHTRIL